MSSLSTILHTLPLIAQANLESSRPASPNGFPVWWILLPTAAVASVGLFLWLSKKTALADQNYLDHLAARDIANWLSQKISAPPEKLLTYLTSPHAPADFQNDYERLIDYVLLKLERDENAYFFTTSLFTIDPKTATAEVVNFRRQLRYDHLPIAVQEKFIHGATQLEISWSPSFQLHTSTQTA